jgi:heme/copper-type cytochrome/quinol oxidase subunit 2
MYTHVLTAHQTVFSMTFFDWSGDSASGEKTRVSSYVWIYVVITVIFTVVTVAAWYFFVILRRRIKMMKSMSSAV